MVTIDCGRGILWRGLPEFETLEHDSWDIKARASQSFTQPIVFVLVCYWSVEFRDDSGMNYSNAAAAVHRVTGYRGRMSTFMYLDKCWWPLCRGD